MSSCILLSLFDEGMHIWSILGNDNSACLCGSETSFTFYVMCRDVIKFP